MHADSASTADNSFPAVAQYPSGISGNTALAL